MKTLDELKIRFCNDFAELKVSISAIHRHLVNNCHFILKRLEKITAVRNSDSVIALRKAIIEQFQSMEDLDVVKNCVFIDEADFNLHIQRNFGRSFQGKPTKGTIPTRKSVTFTILGAISQAGIIDISVKKPEAVSAKKRKTDGKEIKVDSKFGN